MTDRQEPSGKLNLPIIFSVTLLGVMGVAIIAPALPVIMKQFNLTVAQVGLLITFFTVPSVLITPILGVAADRLGRKKIIAFSLLLFGVSGILCGLAGDFGTLLLLRVFQGIGAAALSSLNLTIIGDLYQGSRRAGIMGINSSVLSLGTASYPLLGGALATLAWNFPFFISFLAIPVGFAVLFRLKSPEPDNHESLKTYFASAWKGFKNFRILSLFSLGIMTFIILFGCISTTLSILLSRDFGASALSIGIVMFTMSITTATVSSQLGRIYRRFRKENLLIFGFGCYSIALLLISYSPSLWFFILPMLIFGVGNGLVMPVVQVLVVEQASPEHRAILMSTNGAMLRVGQSIGPPLTALAFAQPNHRWAFYLGIILSLVSILVIIFGIRRTETRDQIIR